MTSSSPSRTWRPTAWPRLLISDATAALAALRARPGFPTNGVVALCDFGAGGTSVTLTNAGSNFQQVGASVRYADFSGDEIDQLISNHLRATPRATTADLPAPHEWGRRRACSVNAGAPRNNCRRQRGHHRDGCRCRYPAVPQRIRATDLRTAGPIRRHCRRNLAAQRNSRSTWRPWRPSAAAPASRCSPPDCRNACRCRSSPHRNPSFSAAVGAAAARSAAIVGGRTDGRGTRHRNTDPDGQRRPADPGGPHCVGSASAAGLVGRRRRGRRAGPLHRPRA